jgi:Loader and inhibitor of phage G40P
VITTSDVLEVLALVAACHPRTAPRLDDREATLAMANTWAELFNEYRLDKLDIVAAVKKRACTHPEAPEPAEIIHFGREIRRDRAERETENQRRAREDRQDAALAARNKARLETITGAVRRLPSPDQTRLPLRVIRPEPLPPPPPDPNPELGPQCPLCPQELVKPAEVAQGVHDRCLATMQPAQPRRNRMSCYGSIATI